MKKRPLTPAEIIAKGKAFIHQYYQDNLQLSRLPFHNIKHVEGVVECVQYLSQHYQVSEQDGLLLVVSALFHDIGYESGCGKGHEERSADLLTKALADELSTEELERARRLIMVTKMGEAPEGIVECIMKDADYFHLHMSDYMAYSNNLWQEFQQMDNGQGMSEQAYLECTLTFLNNHQYYTDFAERNFALGKAYNLQRIEDRLNQLIEQTPKARGTNAKVKKKKRKKKEASVERGVQSMFRLTSRNQISLSSIADNKANILLTVSSLIVSVVTISGYPYAQEHPDLQWAMLMFVVTSLITLILAILSTRPKVSKKPVSKEALTNKSVNLLFFGNFWKMAYPEYEYELNRLITDRKALYNNMIKDQYSLGLVLAKKFKLLRLAYTVFMLGFVGTMITFFLFIYF